MVDEALVQLCARCLADAASQAEGGADLVLTATALARDLTRAHGIDALEVLCVSWRRAIGDLDASDLDAEGFAAALHRLARLRALIEAMLGPAQPSHRVTR